MSERHRDAEATLARAGLSTEQVLAGDVPLARLLELTAGDDGSALVAAFAELPSPAVARQLAALADAVTDRGLRRDIRRALYRLRQRGVVPPERAPRVAPPPSGPGIEGFVSAFDGRGDRLVWLLRRLPAGGTLFVAAELNDVLGLRALHVAETTRKQVRAARQRLGASGFRLVPADWRVLDALLVEGHARTVEPGKARDYPAVRTRLTAEPPATPAEPVSPRAPHSDDADRAALVAGSAALLEQPEFKTWWPDPEAAAPFLAELAGLRESPIVLAPLQQEERARAVLERAVAALFPPGVLARRLEGTAYVLAETGREVAAALALAVAAALRAHPESAEGIPLVSALVRRGLGQLVAADESRRQDERRGALVITPGEALRARSSSRPPHTRG